MKQRISVENLNQLSAGARTKLRAWWKPQRGDWYFDTKRECILLANSVKGKKHIVIESTEIDSEVGDYFDAPDSLISTKKANALPLLTIGQLIEFFGKKEWFKGVVWYDVESHWHEDSGSPEAEPLNANELCDALWRQVTLKLDSK